MQATLERRDMGFRRYRITEGGKVWHASHYVPRDYWVITNRYGHQIHEFGRLGLRIVQACEAEFERLEKVTEEVVG